MEKKEFVTKWRKMLKLQQKLDERILSESGLTYQDIVDRRGYVSAILDELGELNHELKADWCWWKKSQTPVNQDRVYYCRESEIQTRAAKAERKPAQMIVPEEVKKEAEEMAEKRMEEIRHEAKPTFQEVEEWFYALFEVGGTEKAPAKDIVIALAESAVYERVKNGCRWEGETK